MSRLPPGLIGEEENWQGAYNLKPLTYICGYCAERVSSSVGFQTAGNTPSPQQIRICPHCKCPTFRTSMGWRYPGDVTGGPIASAPPDVEALYNEARYSASAGAHTAAVIVCRKILMNVSVSLGAEPGLKFIQYVNFLDAKGYIPPNSKGWIDYIRNRGNDANHEIALMEPDDSTRVILFVEFLLRLIYQFPAMAPGASES